MIVTHMALPRRAFLRGAGAVFALPLLDAMVPALKAAAKATPRMGFYYVPHGMSPFLWKPKSQGQSLEFSDLMAPLAPYRDQTIVFTGLANRQADSLDEAGGPHTRCQAAFLTGARPKRTEGADIRCGTSLDQVAANVLGADTQLRSLEMTAEPGFIVGNCDNGYSCTYVNTISWRSATVANPMESNPRVVFERLFGDGGSAAARLAQMRTDRSILDSIGEDLTRLQQRLGPHDRLTIDEYLGNIRDVERRIVRAEQHSAEAPPPAAQPPTGVPDTYTDHVKLLFDLQWLAMQADVTRVTSFALSRETASSITYSQIGVPEGHHGVSHHQHDPHRLTQHMKINTYHLTLFAHLLERLRSTPDGDGSLLDHTVLLYGSGMGDGDHHSPVDLPVVVVGGGNGQLKGGRHLDLPLDRDVPMMNLGLSLLDMVGVEVDRVGDSTGRLAGLA